MKKLLAIILAALMCCAACTAVAEDVTGEWYANAFGMNLTLIVNGDGTLSMEMAGKTINEGVWEMEGDTFYVNRGQENESFLTVADGRMVNEAEGMDFGREPLEVFEAPAVVAADDATAFDGTWNMTTLSGYGLVLDADDAKEQLGQMFNMKDTTIVADDGSVQIFGNDAVQFEFVDGRLYAAAPEGEDSGLSQTIDLNEDGTIAYTFLGVRMFFEAA